MPEPAPGAAPVRLRRVAYIVGGVLGLVLVGGTAARIVAAQDLKTDTAALATPAVAVFRPDAAVVGTVTLPGRIEAWNQAPVYARTNGYLKRWNVDIGARVRTGEVLAEIEAPDLDQQLAGAVAALGTATAQRDLAQVTAARWSRLVGERAVSQQEADERQGDLAAREALRREAAANLAQLRAMAGFKRIVAPFDGVVTSRATDVGALIVAGQASSAPLFTVADTRRLRIYVGVPQNQAAMFRPGGKASFTTPDQPGRIFTAEVSRTAEAVDPRSGAVLTQLIVDNTDGALRPGGYVLLTLEPSGPTADEGVSVPASALLFRREGVAVAVVDGSGKVAVRPIRIARDRGKDVVIHDGLTRRDWVIDNPSSAIGDGQTVKVVRREASHARS